MRSILGHADVSDLSDQGGSAGWAMYNVRMIILSPPFSKKKGSLMKKFMAGRKEEGRGRGPQKMNMRLVREDSTSTIL
jgi:hypothetical protein